MNKPQYLGELRRLLVFMTSADRDRTVARCGQLFDQAGPDGIDDLIAHIGSPTRVSIRLSRTYEPGRLDLSSLDLPAPAPAPEPEPVPEAEPEPAVPDMVEGLPDLDVPPLVMDDLSGFEMIPPQANEPEPVDTPPEDGPGPETPAEAPAPAPNLDGPRFISMPLDHDDGPEDVPEEAPDVIIERAMPLWVGVPLFIICLIVLALPIGLICLLLLPVLLLPGLALLLGTYLAAVGGLWCTSYIADALMLFGLAFLILSVALVTLWCGLRLDVGIVSLFVRGWQAVSHLTLGKKVIPHA